MARLSLPFSAGAIFALVVMSLQLHQSLAQDTTIQLQIVTQRGLAVGAEREWLSALRKAGITSVRIRQGTGRETPKVENVGTEQRPRYIVTGVLLRGNRLQVPGGAYTSRQVDQLAKWLDRVKQRGADAAVGPPEAFGLTAGELVKLHEQLAARLETSTKNQPLSAVLAEVRRRVMMPMHISPTAERQLREADPCPDELKGISAGTALAAALRPAGLCFVPKVVGRGRFELFVMPTRQAQERWPVGWPPVQIPAKTAPTLFKYAVVEIEDQPLSAVLDAISARTSVPFLFDHNSMALAGIDPRQATVSLPARRSFYKSHVDRLLQQAKLKATLKMDESGRPLLWISPIRKY